jgi:membrane-bound serine protease (ClpP class)
MTRRHADTRQFRLVCILCGLSALGGSPVLVPAAQAQEDERPAEAQRLNRGALVSVPLPIPSGGAELIKTKIERAVERLSDTAVPGGDRPVLVLEFRPTGRSAYGESTSFEAALSLARFLMSKEIAAVRTVAYLPQTIKGHSVLVAMACEQIVMAPEAEIGDAGIAERGAEVIDPSIVEFYRHVAVSRRTIPEQVAIGMIDPALEVLKVKTEQGAVQYVTSQELEELKETSTIVDSETVIRPGTLGNFVGREARQMDFAKHLAANHDELATALALSESALIEDQATLGQWRPVFIEVEGPITPRKARQVANMVAEQRDRHGVNWIGVQIDSAGGDIEACLNMADTLARQDPAEVRTVAFVTGQASGGAALVALACDQLVMAGGATLGGGGFEPLDADLLPQSVRTLETSLAGRIDHPWSVLAAMIDPQIEILPHRHRETGRVRYMSAAERDAYDDRESWQRAGEPLNAPGELLSLSAEEAKELGLAWQVVQNPDDLYHIFGFERAPPKVKPNWALEFVEALAAPGFAILLLIIGFVGLYIELQTPGLGFGGFIASVAFLLFFWSKFLDNSAGWLEVLLFVSGMCFMLLEVFVLPGFGIFGFGGGLLVIASLVLASQTFILPHSAREMAELRNSLLVVTAAGVGTIATALALRRYLPKAPMFNLLMLSPLEAEERDELEYREVVADFSDLVGQRGEATTHLRPAGRAEIAGELVDVIAEGGTIDRGTTVEVVFAKANRVIVRPVTDDRQA